MRVSALLRLGEAHPGSVWEQWWISMTGSKTRARHPAKPRPLRRPETAKRNSSGGSDGTGERRSGAQMLTTYFRRRCGNRARSSCECPGLFLAPYPSAPVVSLNQHLASVPGSWHKSTSQPCTGRAPLPVVQDLYDPQFALVQRLAGRGLLPLHGGGLLCGVPLMGSGSPALLRSLGGLGAWSCQATRGAVVL